MTRIVFIHADGEHRTEAVATGHDVLLTLAQSVGMPLEGTCEGQMACSTCHVIVDPAFFPALPPPSEPEEDMLDFAAGATRTSRLSCQIALDDCPDGMIVRIPAEARNMQGI